MPSYPTLTVILIISLLVFIYPFVQGIRAFLRAGLLGIIDMIVAFVGGYYVLERWELGLALLVGGMVLWLVGRVAVNRRYSGDRSISAK